jgi:hypothetical protein
MNIGVTKTPFPYFPNGIFVTTSKFVALRFFPLKQKKSQSQGGSAIFLITHMIADILQLHRRLNFSQVPYI